MATTAINIAIRAELSDFRKQLAALPNVTKAEAQKMVAELRVAIRETQKLGAEAGKAGQQAATGMGAAGAATANLQAQVYDVGQQLSAGTNPLIILSQQGPQIAQAMGMAGGGVRALGAALVGVGVTIGGVAAVIGPFVLGWAALTEEQRKNDAIAAGVADTYASMAGIMEDTRAKTVELAVATGELTKAQGDAYKAGAQGLGSWMSATGETRERLAELHKEQGSLTTAIVDGAQAFLRATPTGGLWASALDGITTDSEELTAESTALRNALNGTVDTLRENVAVGVELAEVTNANAAADRSATDAARQRDKAAKEQRAALEELLALERQRSDQLLTDQGRVEVTSARELDRIAELAGAYQDVPEIQQAAYDASIAVREAAAVDLAEIREQELDAELAALHERAEAERRLLAEIAADEDRYRKERIAEEQAMAGAIGSIYGSVADLALTLAGQMAEGNRDAAMSMFMVAKGAGIAQVVIDTALAVSKINAAWSAVPPVAAALTAAAIATGAAQTAAIAGQQPAFHTGGVVTADLLVGESVLNQQATANIGEDGVAALNRGESPSSSVTIQQVYKGRVYDAITTDALARPGSPLRRAVNAGRPKPGRRSR